MASVFKKRKSYIAQIVRDGRRIPANLGAISRSDAALAKQMLTQLERSAHAGAVPSAAALSWLNAIGDKMHEAVAKLGLAEPRKIEPVIPMTIEKLEEAYLATRADLRYRTVNNIQQSMRSIVRHTGPGVMVARFTANEARAWRRAVSTKYSGPTVSMFVKKSRQVFRWAVSKGIIASNPLDGIHAGQQVNEDRSIYVPAETVHQVIGHITDTRWKLLVAMSRFAGLRVPSAAALMKWSDINWNATPIAQMTVQSPKTKGQGRASRRVPISDELKPLLKLAQEQRDMSEDRIFPFVYATKNPRTALTKAILRAGLEPWPRLWHNMRASCQTDLEDHIPTHSVCRFMGNSPTTARKHYLQTKHEHWLKAAAAQTAARNAIQTAQYAQSIMSEPTKTNEKATGDTASGSANLPPRGVEPLLIG